MSNSSLDELLRQAELDKVFAETKKLHAEAEAIVLQANNGQWSERFKTLAAIAAGIMGVLTGYTKYEVTEIQIKRAEEKLSSIQKELATINRDKEIALAERVTAISEREEAERATKGFKESLTLATNELALANPQVAKTRLTYLQFRGALSPSIIGDLKAHLKKEAFNVPGAERVKTDQPLNFVKYFESSDSVDAQRLAKSVEDFFASKHCPLSINLIPVKATSGHPPLEIWLSPNDCQFNP